MKKMIIFVFLLTIIIMVFGIGFLYLNKENNLKISKIEGVTLEIKEETLSSTGATIIITDVTKQKHLYGERFKIQKLVNGKWKNLKVKNNKVVFPTVGYYVDDNNKLELKQNWEELYGDLPNGKYRLIKHLLVLSDNLLEKEELHFATEFSIKNYK